MKHLLGCHCFNQRGNTGNNNLPSLFIKLQLQIQINKNPNKVICLCSCGKLNTPFKNTLAPIWKKYDGWRQSGDATHCLPSRPLYHVLPLDYKQGIETSSLLSCLIYIPPSLIFSVAKRITNWSSNTVQASALHVILYSQGEWLLAPMFGNPLNLPSGHRGDVCPFFFF